MTYRTTQPAQQPPVLPFVDVPAALAEFRAGRMVVIVDDENRENEGDLALAAEHVTPEAINFMARFGRGLVCLTLTEERADHLCLNPMVHQNSSRFGTAFTETIEAREGVTTGISAHDRAHTIRVAIGPGSTADDLARPGHIFPLRARSGGVLVRPGQTEASVDLARLAGLTPAGVICEIMNEDGTMARVPDLVAFCQRHELKMLTVAELIRYRLRTESQIARVASGSISTPYGDFHAVEYRSRMRPQETHFALLRGWDPDTISGTHEPVLVRIHTHCLPGNVFGSSSCDCQAALRRSFAAVAHRGVLLYLRSGDSGLSEPSTISPGEDALSGHGHGTPHQSVAGTGICGQILSDLGIRKVILDSTSCALTLEDSDVAVVEQFPATARLADQAPASRESTLFLVRSTAAPQVTA